MKVLEEDVIWKYTVRAVYLRKHFDHFLRYYSFYKVLNLNASVF